MDDPAFWIFAVAVVVLVVVLIVGFIGAVLEWDK